MIFVPRSHTSRILSFENPQSGKHLFTLQTFKPNGGLKFPAGKAINDFDRIYPEDLYNPLNPGFHLTQQTFKR